MSDARPGPMSRTSVKKIQKPTPVLPAPSTSSAASAAVLGPWAGATVIASVHRMSVLPHFDRVVLMRAGRIEDVGTINELMGRSVQEDCAVFLTLSGAMTPAGLHRSCLVPLVQRGVISALTTTGANLYHDAHRVIGHRIREIAPDVGDRQRVDAGEGLVEQHVARLRREAAGDLDPPPLAARESQRRRAA